MAYNRYGNRSSWRYGSRRYGNNNRRKSKYTQAEQIAFKLGQQQRVKDAINSGDVNTRVYEAFAKGFAGAPSNGKKPLFHN